MTESVSAPVVSVVMPVYNAEQTIVHAIDSALNQSFNNLELIVVDDGSSDSSAELIASYNDSRLRCIQIPRSGPSAARNAGAHIAAGAYLAFLDADDSWHQEKLLLQLDALKYQADASLVYCWVDFTDEHLNHTMIDDRARHEGNVYSALLRGNFISSGSNSLVRADAFHAVGGFDKKLLGAEDWEFHVRVAARYTVTCVPRVLVLYRQSAQSWSRDLRRLESHYLQAANQVFAAAPTEYQVARKACDARFYRYCTGVMWRPEKLTTYYRVFPWLRKALLAEPLTTIRRCFTRVGHVIVKSVSRRWNS